MTDEPRPPSERTKVEQLLIRLIQGQDAVLHRLDLLRRAVEFAPLVLVGLLAALGVAWWLLQAVLR